MGGGAMDVDKGSEQNPRPVSAGRLAWLAASTPADLPFILLDITSTCGAYLIALALRFDGAVPSEHWADFWRFLPIAVTLHIAVGWAAGLYGPVWRHAGVLEARRLLASCLGVVAVLNLLWYVAGSPLPRAVLFIGPAGQVAVSGIVRFHSRLFAFRRSGERETSGMRVVVVGAGSLGATAAREMQRVPQLGLVPVAFVDDDPKLRSRTILGVPVAGTTDDLPAVIRRLGANQVLFTIEGNQDLMRRVADHCEAAGVSLKVMPSVEELIGGRPSVRDARDLRIEDLLGRRQAETDLAAVRAMLAGRRILVTGGGGSIGTEIARQVAKFDPAELAILDNDETHLHDAAAVIDGPVTVLLGDVRDRNRMFELFSRIRPEIVFHAAALKHVPVLEDHPCEAVMTNVVGTCNVLDAADQVGVSHLVFISTDKAVRPTSVMGASKWLGEQLTMRRSRAGHRCAVRFGNVLGSRGSVVPTFTRQIMAGGPVTVTHPDMTRFFMSIPEAVQLVLQAAALSRGEEIFMLDMGEPVKILSLAERMIRLTGRVPGHDIAIEITGARPGEKLAEELARPDEVMHPTDHPAILRLDPALLSIAELETVVDQLVAAAVGGRANEVRSILLATAHHGLDVIDLTDRATPEEQSRPWSPSTT